MLGTWQWKTKWQPVSPSMDYAVLTRESSLGQMRITAVRADTNRWKVRVITPYLGDSATNLNVWRHCPPLGAIINAGFFDDNAYPIGVVISGGKTIHSAYRGKCTFGGWAVFYIRSGHPAITSLETFDSDHVTEAVQCGPILVRNGTIPKLGDRVPAMRAAVGLDAHGNIIFAVLSGNLTLKQWAVCMRDQLHCRDALNLDGGPSAQIAFRGKTVRSISNGVDCPVFLQLVPK